MDSSELCPTCCKPLATQKDEDEFQRTGNHEGDPWRAMCWSMIDLDDNCEAPDWYKAMTPLDVLTIINSKEKTP